MNNASVEIVHTTAGQCVVRGALTFATAKIAHDAGRACFGASDGNRIEVDCAGVTAADSAGLAVLLDWLAFAKMHGRHIHFIGLPDELIALAKISEVDELLLRGD